MSLRAVSLILVVFSLIASPAIHFVSYSFQMFRIAAERVAAQMIDFESFRDWADQHFVNDSVYFLISIVDKNMPIAITIARAARGTHPEPAIGFWIDVNIAPNAIRKLRDVHQSSFTLGGAVSTA